jgi:polar amino acid transport system ATP-binding protein
MTPTPVPKMRVDEVDKSFGDNKRARPHQPDVAEREVICLIGASGSGKSTLLRCINLLEPVDDGVIELDGHSSTSANRAWTQPDPTTGRHGVPEFQPVPAHVAARQRGHRSAQGARSSARVPPGLRRESFSTGSAWPTAPTATPTSSRVVSSNGSAIARALAIGPEVMLLDEITSCARPRARGRGARRGARAEAQRDDHAASPPTRWGSPGRSATGCVSWTGAASSKRVTRPDVHRPPSTSAPSSSSSGSSTPAASDPRPPPERRPTGGVVPVGCARSPGRRRRRRRASRWRQIATSRSSLPGPRRSRSQREGVEHGPEASSTSLASTRRSGTRRRT